MSELPEALDVSAWPFLEIEPGGDDEKLWLREPSTQMRWLFKPVVERSGHRQGEDWAEKITAGVAGLLRVPAAPIEVAVRLEGVRARHGCISRNVRPPGWESHSGAVLLAEIVDDFKIKDRIRRGHTLTNIRRVLEGYGPPPEFDGPATFSAFDVFTGYLVLDACVANQDRHSENWSVLVAPVGTRFLMASYDHASSLGFGLTDDGREDILSRLGIDRWIRKGIAQRFEDGRAVTLVDHAMAGLSMVADEVRTFWVDRVRSATPAQAEAVVADTPQMSQQARTFCVRVLEANRERLLQ